MDVNLSSLKTSWTKYDIVQVMACVESIEKMQSFKNGEVVINEAILKTFLNIRKLSDVVPHYWSSIQNFPKQKNLFALLSLIFTHYDVIKIFCDNAKLNRGGILQMQGGNKMYTNLRSALVESGAALSNYRRSEEVPYDLSLLYKNGKVGKLFKDLLIDRFNIKFNLDLTEQDLFNISQKFSFHEALSLSEKQFVNWLSGKPITDDKSAKYLQEIHINNFLSIKEANLDFEDSKEIYFVGENGDGKSLFLMASYLAFNFDFVLNETDHGLTGSVQQLIRSAIGELKGELKGVDNSDKEYGEGKKANLNNFFAYGTHRGRIAKSGDPEKYGFMSLFDTDQTLVNPIQWLKNLRAIELEKVIENKQNKIAKIDFIRIKDIEEVLFEILEQKVNLRVSIQDVEFVEKGNIITFDQLSEGFRTVIIFVVDLLFRLNRITKPSENIFDTPAIVIVDEIDSHLHPKWKLSLVKKLRILFKNIQFIFTTHSPTIIQGASEDAIIYRVYRDSENGNTKITDKYYRKDLNHMMLNTLVTSSLFGLTNARLSHNNEESDTSDDYLTSRIYAVAKERIDKRKKEGISILSEEEIDSIINEIFDSND